MNAFATTQRLNAPLYDVVEMFEQFPERTFLKGEEILNKHHSPKGIIFILMGKVLSFSIDEIEGKELVNNYFMDNSFLNLYSLSSDIPGKQSAVALSKTTIKIIPFLNFHKLLNESYTLQQRVLQLLLKTANQKQIYLHRMIRMSSRQRILFFLLDYVADVGHRIGYEWVIRNPFSMTQIGQLTHTSRQTTSTLMNDLKRRGMINFNRKYLIFRDLTQLKKQANSINSKL